MFFLVTYRWTGDRRDAAPVMPDHRVWTFDQMKAGRMLMSGPTPDYSLGIQLFNAESLEDVQALCESEPTVAAGHRTFDVTPWSVHAMYGFELASRTAPPQEAKAAAAV